MDLIIFDIIYSHYNMEAFYLSGNKYLLFTSRHVFAVVSIAIFHFQHMFGKN